MFTFLGLLLGFIIVMIFIALEGPRTTFGKTLFCFGGLVCVGLVMLDSVIATLS